MASRQEVDAAPPHSLWRKLQGENSRTIKGGGWALPIQCISHSQVGRPRWPHMLLVGQTVVMSRDACTHKGGSWDIPNMDRAVLCSVTVVSDSVTPWTAARQAPRPRGILQARVLEWVTCSPPGDLPNPGIEPRSPVLQVDSLSTEPPRKPRYRLWTRQTKMTGQRKLRRSVPYKWLKLPQGDVYPSLCVWVHLCAVCLSTGTILSFPPNKYLLHYFPPLWKFFPEGPGPLSLTTGLVARIWFSLHCDPISAWKAKLQFKPWQVKATQDQPHIIIRKIFKIRLYFKNFPCFLAISLCSNSLPF